MQRGSSLTRRRALQITGAICGSALLPFRTLAKGKGFAPVSWRGVALGAPAEINLYAEDERLAQDALRRAILEIRRLEKIFSLYKPASAISRLNRNGQLHNPPLDLVRLVSTAKGVSATTGGAFDMTIQPLWMLYSRHFSHRPEPNIGPDERDLERAVALVDYRAVNVAAHRIALGKPGMGISLNGIAQGYITDNVADILRRSGFENLLVNVGEIRGVGTHPAGRPWTVGITAAGGNGSPHKTLEITDQAVATSAPAGTPLNSKGTAHHLFDPRTGACAAHYRSITVIAETAILADAYSTGFAVMAWPEICRVVEAGGKMHVYALTTDGHQRSVTGNHA